jgi:hypothetical protein
MVNPFVNILDGLKACLDALKIWHEKQHANLSWFFPEFDGTPVCRKSLAKLEGKKLTSHGMRAFYVTARGPRHS